MRCREIALPGLLFAACGFPNPNFMLLTEVGTSGAADATADVTTADPTAESTTDRPTTGDTATTRGDTDPSTPTGVTVDPTGDPTTVTSSDTQTVDDTTAATLDPSTGDTGDTGDTDDTTTGAGLLPDCVPQDLSLRACYDFTYGDGVQPLVLVDGSMYGHDGTVEFAMVVPGIEGSALRSVDGTKIKVADKQFDWPDQAITMTAWIRPKQLPDAGKYHGVLHKGTDFGLGIIGGVGVACRVGAGGTETMLMPEPDVWTHIACVYDNGAIEIFINGITAGPSALNDVNIEGTTVPLLIGCGNDVCSQENHFIGDIDNVRLWSAAVKPNVICAEAGNPNCL